MSTENIKRHAMPSDIKRHLVPPIKRHVVPLLEFILEVLISNLSLRLRELREVTDQENPAVTFIFKERTA